MTGEQVTDRWEKVPATGRKRMNTIRFDELDLNPQILRGIADMGFEEATPIQSQAIPVVLSDRLRPEPARQQLLEFRFYRK